MRLAREIENAETCARSSRTRDGVVAVRTRPPARTGSSRPVRSHPDCESGFWAARSIPRMKVISTSASGAQAARTRLCLVARLSAKSVEADHRAWRHFVNGFRGASRSHAHHPRMRVSDIESRIGHALHHRYGSALEAPVSATAFRLADGQRQSHDIPSLAKLAAAIAAHSDRRGDAAGHEPRAAQGQSRSALRGARCRCERSSRGPSRPLSQFWMRAAVPRAQPRCAQRPWSDGPRHMLGCDLQPARRAVIRLVGKISAIRAFIVHTRGRRIAFPTRKIRRIPMRRRKPRSERARLSEGQPLLSRIIIPSTTTRPKTS